MSRCTSPSRSRRSLPAALAGVLGGLVLLAGPGAGQEAPPSILSLLDPGSRTLTQGGSVEGSLTIADFVSTDGRPVQAWRYSGQEGEMVTFDLVSTDFDAFLYLLGPGFLGHLMDDDGGGGCNSRLSTTLPLAGDYTLVVSALSAPGSTNFTLSASPEPGPPTGSGGCGAGSAWDPVVLQSLDAGGRTLGARAEATGRITEADLGEDGTHAQAWDLEGAAGEPLTVDLISDDFDAFLLLTGPGLMGVLSDDDGGGNCHSRLTLDLTEAGPYRAVVSTVGDPGEGAFTLRTSAAPGPMAEGNCGTYDQILGTLGGDLDLSVLADADTGDRVLPSTGEVSGTLVETDERFPGNGGPMQAWLLQGTAGQQVTLDLGSSAFDPYLALAGPGLAEPLLDDDGGEGFDSRITVTLPADGAFRVVVTSVGQRVGAYTLRISGG